MSYRDEITAAIRKAFQLGQTYWQQADSESYKENKKSLHPLRVTRNKRIVHPSAAQRLPDGRTRWTIKT